MMKKVNKTISGKNEINIELGKNSGFSSIFFRPENLLQGHILNAVELSKSEHKLVKLSILRHDFYICYDNNIIYSTAGHHAIKPLCLLQHQAKVEIDTMQIEKIDYFETLDKWSIESFSWFIACWTSRGRVPLGTSLDELIFLKELPNFEELPKMPHAEELALFIFNKPKTLKEIIKISEVSTHYVYAFYWACVSLDLIIGFEDPQSDVFDELDLSEEANDMMFTRIWDKLSI